MTTMRLPFNLSPLDSDSTVVAFDSLGSATFANGVTFASAVSFTQPANFGAAVLATTLTTVQASAWQQSVYSSVLDSDGGIVPASIGFLAVQVAGSTMYVQVFSGSARFGLG